MININSLILQSQDNRDASQQQSNANIKGHPKSAKNTALTKLSKAQASSHDSELIDHHDRKNICFVITDEEIFFSKQLLVRHSPYIAQLV